MNGALHGNPSRTFTSRPPTAKHRLFETDNPDVASNLFAKEFVPHDIEVTSRAKRFHSVAHKALMAGIALYRVQYSSDVVINVGPLRNYYLMHIPISGRVRVVCEGHTTDITPGSIGIVNPFAGYALHRLDDCTQLTLRFDRAGLEGHLFELLGHAPNGPIAFASDKAIKFADCGSLIRLIELIHADVFDAGGALGDEFCGIPTENLLARLLLRQVPNNYADGLAEAHSKPAPYYVKRAEDFIARNAQQPITMTQLVDVARVSARTLFEGFRNFRDVSPMRHAKNVRLDRVRAELVGMRSEYTKRRSLTEIAGKWGFGHMGNFSNDYKQRFGERPSQTMRAADYSHKR